MNGGSKLESSEARIILLSILLSAMALAYFYMTDNVFFSTKYMSAIFRLLLMLQDWNSAWLALSGSLAAYLFKRDDLVERLIDWVAKHVSLVALGTVVLLSLASIFVYKNTAFSMDEYAAVFQAKIFAAGSLAGHVSPSVVDWLVPPGFNGAFLVVSRITGRAIEAYWPGYSLLLAPFQAFGLPWLCNALLAGCSVVLVYRIALEISAERRIAAWAVFLLVCSGTFAGNAISLYAMQAHLTANLLFAYLLMKPGRVRAFLAGVVGSYALILHNPFPHTMFAAPWLLWLLRSRPDRHRLLFVILGYCPVMLVIGAGWLHLRADITAGSSGFNVISNNLLNVFSIPDETMVDVKIASTVKMIVWAVPSLFVLAILGFWRWRQNNNVMLLAQSALLTLFGYMFFIFDQGHGWGYRYFHSAFGVVLILGACAFAGPWREQRRLSAFAGAAACFNLLIVVPFQLYQMADIVALHSGQLPPASLPGNHVYFVQNQGFYMADMVQMDPFLRDRDLVLFSAGEAQDQRLLEQNWPEAKRVDKGIGFEEWYLGDEDLRKRGMPGGVAQWDLRFSPRQ